MDPSQIIGLITGAAGAGAVLVAAISKALVAKDRAESRELAQQNLELRKQNLKLRAELAEVVASCGVEPGDSLLDLIQRSLAGAGAQAVGGVVCANDEYVYTWNFDVELGHHDVEGADWKDPRFVAAEDLPESKAVAAEGFSGGNTGQRIVMLTAGGTRREGRVYSTPIRKMGRGHRVFVVVFRGAK